MYLFVTPFNLNQSAVENIPRFTGKAQQTSLKVTTHVSLVIKYQKNSTVALKKSFTTKFSDNLKPVRINKLLKKVGHKPENT